jgi:hypothetical protein
LRGTPYIKMAGRRRTRFSEWPSFTAGPKMMMTRRHVLGATGGLAALAASGAAAAQRADVSTQARNATMQIMRSGSRPSAKGPTEYFTGAVRVDPMFQAGDPHACPADMSRSSRARAARGTRIRWARP